MQVRLDFEYEEVCEAEPYHITSHYYIILYYIILYYALLYCCIILYYIITQVRLDFEYEEVCEGGPEDFAVELETDLAEATGTDPRRVEAII